MRSVRFWVFALCIPMLLLGSAESFAQTKSKKEKVHVNSIERIIYEFRGKLPTSLDGNSFISLSRQGSKAYKNAVTKQMRSIRRDPDHQMVPQFPFWVVTPNYPCGAGICPCSSEIRGTAFILIHNDSSRNSVNLFITQSNGDELKLQPKRQVFDNHPVQSFIIDSSLFCKTGRSSLKVEKTSVGGKKESFYFRMRCDSIRLEKPDYRFKGLLTLSNK